ncbi:7789_t:CDS:2 [Paraglomus occultum]|uniref:7789_t:CDS:1 n=1 Tax=Paraglomus occultum TaxID=144539 RepID=A0A9N9FEB2_9GLOM|nr:7789_t:CDS:2 [Paraglomus occultum]
MNEQSPADQNNKNEDRSICNMDLLNGLLAGSVEHLQNSFSTIYATLATNFQTTLEMTQSMNAVMEQLLVSNTPSNITQLEQYDGNEECTPIPLTITVSNLSNLPITDASFDIVFQKKDIAETAYVNINHAESFQKGLRKNSREERRMEPPIFEPMARCNIPPQTQIIEKLILLPMQIAQLNCKVTVTFASPGTGKLLYVEHIFGIYIIDQCRKQIQKALPAQEFDYTCSVSLPTSLLRQLWNVHPCDGIDESTVFELVAKERLPGCIFRSAVGTKIRLLRIAKFWFMEARRFLP